MAIAATSATSSTNIDVNGIVSQLMTLEQRPISLLNAKEASYQAKLSAYGSISGALSGFQGAISILNSAIKAQALAATSSDATTLTASATSTAAAGVYGIDITALAQAQRLVAAGQTSDTTAIGTGAATTLTFDAGTISGGTFDPVTGTYAGAAFASNGGVTHTVTIDSSNNTLQGIRDAINKANVGVTATIINDGSATPFRLVLSSSTTGVANSAKITVAGDATLSTLLTQDPAAAQNLSQTTAAQNAALKINGIALSKASNSVTDAIAGVTLNLSKITTVTTNLTIAPDNAPVTSAVTGFVKAYNDLAKALKSVSAYDPAAKRGAILQGDATVRTIQAQVRGILSSAVSGAAGSLTNLSQVGVAFQKDGSLALDSSKLNTALAGGFNNVASLFGAIGTSTDTLVSYSGSSTSTIPGSYGINVTQLATQGNALGTTAVAASTTITAGINDSLNLTVNGISVSISLPGGTYTPQQLATALQTQINASAGLTPTGVTVATSIDPAGMLSISTSKYGSATSIAITSGTAMTDLFGVTPVTQTAGLDVAGTIGNATATGSGQILTATGGAALGLAVQVNGGTLGIRGSVSFSQGYAAKLDNLATSLLANDGMLAGRTQGINSTIKDIGMRRDALQRRLMSLEESYRRQYSALDTMLTSMNQTSTYLTQQLARMD
jgi:flagellar hook-associated protein 2